MYWISTSCQTKLLPFVGITVTNFGGAARKGTNNVFVKLTTSDLEMNIRDIGCAAHILHNALRTSADILPIDGEDIVNKIFQYFHIPSEWKNERNFVTSLILNTNRFLEV
jgi:hypothetical protein